MGILDSIAYGLGGGVIGGAEATQKVAENTVQQENLKALNAQKADLEVQAQARIAENNMALQNTRRAQLASQVAYNPAQQVEGPPDVNAGQTSMPTLPRTVNIGATRNNLLASGNIAEGVEVGKADNWQHASGGLYHQGVLFKPDSDNPQITPLGPSDGGDGSGNPRFTPDKQVKVEQSLDALLSSRIPGRTVLAVDPKNVDPVTGQPRMVNVPDTVYQNGVQQLSRHSLASDPNRMKPDVDLTPHAQAAVAQGEDYMTQAEAIARKKFPAGEADPRYINERNRQFNYNIARAVGGVRSAPAAAKGGLVNDAQAASAAPEAPAPGAPEAAAPNGYYALGGRVTNTPDWARADESDINSYASRGDPAAQAELQRRQQAVTTAATQRTQTAARSVNMRNVTDPAILRNFAKNGSQEAKDELQRRGLLNSPSPDLSLPSQQR